MDEIQFEQFQKQEVPTRTISVNDLRNTKARTLLLGNRFEGETLHVYLDSDDGQIHVLKYVPTAKGTGALTISHTGGKTGGVTRNLDFTAGYKLHPESCDMEFCTLLRREEVPLNFTEFNRDGLERVDQFKGFAGYRVEDIPFGINLEKCLTSSTVQGVNEKILAIRIIVWNLKFEATHLTF